MGNLYLYDKILRFFSTGILSGQHCNRALSCNPIHKGRPGREIEFSLWMEERMKQLLLKTFHRFPKRRNLSCFKKLFLAELKLKQRSGGYFSSPLAWGPTSFTGCFPHQLGSRAREEPTQGATCSGAKYPPRSQCLDSPQVLGLGVL